MRFFWNGVLGKSVCFASLSLFFLFSHHVKSCFLKAAFLESYSYQLLVFSEAYCCQCSLGDSMSGEQDHVSKSSSSSISSSTQESEEEVSVTIGSLLAQANSRGRHSLGKRLSHLGSIPVIQSQLMFGSLLLFASLNFT